MMMCKPSKHLVEYIENQNIDVQDIIRDLPEEMPITEYNDNKEANTNVENNVTEGVTTPPVSSDINNVVESSTTPPATNEVNNAASIPAMPVIDAPQSEAATEAPQIVNGQAESIAPKGADGNVQLAATAVVQPIGEIGQAAPNVVNQQVAVSANNQVAATVPATTQPTLVRLGE